VKKRVAGGKHTVAEEDSHYQAPALKLNNQFFPNEYHANVRGSEHEARAKPTHKEPVNFPNSVVKILT
jgi:hypothetical protein